MAHPGTDDAGGFTATITIGHGRVQLTTAKYISVVKSDQMAPHFQIGMVLLLSSRSLEKEYVSSMNHK